MAAVRRVENEAQKQTAEHCEQLQQMTVSTALRLSMALLSHHLITAVVGAKTEIVPFSDTVQIVEAPYLKPDPDDWQNPRNTQPTAMACMKQCESLPKCRFGTYIAGGERNKECWLSNHGGEGRTVQCGDPCVSFTKEVLGAKKPKKDDTQLSVKTNLKGKKPRRETFAEMEAQLKREETRVGKSEHDVRYDEDLPVMFLLGANPDYVLKGKHYKDPGASCVDPGEGDISHLVTKKEEVVDTSTLVVTYQCKNTHAIYSLPKKRTVIKHDPESEKQEKMIQVDARLPKENIGDFSQDEMQQLATAIAKVLALPTAAVMIDGGSEFDDSIVLEIFVRVVSTNSLPQPEGFNSKVAATIGQMRAQDFRDKVRRAISGDGTDFKALSFSEAQFATDGAAMPTGGASHADARGNAQDDNGRHTFLLFGILVAVSAASTLFISNRKAKIASATIGTNKKMRSRIEYKEIEEPQDDELLLIG